MSERVDLEEIWKEKKTSCLFCRNATTWYLTLGSGLRLQGRCKFGVQTSIGFSCPSFVRIDRDPRITLGVPTLLKIRDRLNKRVILELRIKKVIDELRDVVE